MLEGSMPDSRAFDFRFVLLQASAAISLPLLAGFFGALHPALDSFAHFRVHLAVLLVAISLPLLAGALRWPGLLAMLFGIGALATVSGIPGLGVVHASFQPRDPGAAAYRLLQMNLRFDNAEPAKVISLIGRIQPDVMTLEEVSEMWEAKLDLLVAAYPHRIDCGGGPGTFGVAILSRRPLLAGIGCSHDGALARAIVNFGGRHVEVAAVHLGWPWPFDQPAPLDELAPALGELAGTAMFAGDLNATPWSAASSDHRIGELEPIGPLGPTWLYRRLPEFCDSPVLRSTILRPGDVVVHDARFSNRPGPTICRFSWSFP